MHASFSCSNMTIRTVFRFFEQIRSQLSRDPLDRCRWMRLPSVLHSKSDKPKDRLARSGEEAARRWLENNGMTVLHQNVRFQDGELDIIAREGATLVFVEVKTRQSDEFGTPDIAVNGGKQRRQIAAAGRFISLCRLQNVPVRFDIITVLWPSNGVPSIAHFRNAFRANDL